MKNSKSRIKHLFKEFVVYVEDEGGIHLSVLNWVCEVCINRNDHHISKNQRGEKLNSTEKPDSSKCSPNEDL